MKFSRRHITKTIAVALALLVIALVGAAASKAHPTQETSLALAIGPYLDYQPFVVAHQLGIDRQQGLDFKLTTLPAVTNVAAAIRRGDADSGYSAHSPTFSVVKAVPEIRSWFITNHFKGFMVIGRRGETLIYDNRVKSIGHAKARAEVLRSFKGKTFTIVGVQFKPLLDSALKQIGLNTDDVKILDFADDAKAALAFVRGEGDYYIGSLPQEMKMLIGSPDKFVRVGGAEMLGPAGLWYSTMISMDSWLDQNPETALKLMAVWYRTMRYIKERPGKFIPLLRTAINAKAAAAFKLKEVEFLTKKLIGFYTLDEAKKLVFTSGSPLYWRRSAQYYFVANKKNLPGDAKLDVIDVENQWFTRFLNRRDLVAWVNSPLT